MSPHHYVYGSGSPGCLYDNQGTCDTLDQAIDAVLFPFVGCDPELTEAELTEAELADARADLRAHGIHYFPASRRGELGAGYVEVSREHGENPEHYEEFVRDFDSLQSDDSVGMSTGVRRVALVATDSAPTHFTVFAFGAYSATYVAVGYEVNPYHAANICDHLEEATVWLKEHAPGCLSEPDYEGARADIMGETGCGDDMLSIDDDSVRERAETDHTYTGSGWLLSYEWTIVAEAMERDDLLAWIRNV